MLNISLTPKNEAVGCKGVLPTGSGCARGGACSPESPQVVAWALAAAPRHSDASEPLVAFGIPAKCHRGKRQMAFGQQK